MLKIRLHRTGKTTRPHYRVVVAEHRRAAQGPYVASLGVWDPLTHTWHVDDGKLKEWMDRGAKPTDRLSRLLKSKGMKHRFIQIHERPARGPKKVKEEGSTGRQEQKATEAAEESEKQSAEPVAESEKSEDSSASLQAPAESPPSEKAKVETPAEPVEPAAREDTAHAEGEERAKSPAGDQANPGRRGTRI
jgi:small subunit ribosomal protein S16